MRAGAYTQFTSVLRGKDVYTYDVKTVLVVDDDAIIRRLVHDALEKRHGWTVLEAEDGVDGVARFLLHRPDILITDITMPNTDGLEMLDILKKGGQLDGVRVVIISGILAMTAIKEKNPWPAAMLLSKPFNLQDLYEAVGE